jgi:putative aldouronate transport system substrate-binding protein
MDGYADEGAVYEIDGMDAPVTGDGEALHYRWTDDFSPLKRRDSWAVSTACENPEAVMEIVNYLFSDAGELFFNYGTEGYTFEYGADGTPQYTDLILNNPDVAYSYATYLFVSNVATEYLPGIMDATTGYYYFTDYEWAIFDRFRDCDADGSYNMPTAVTLTEDENTAYAAISSDIDTYVNTALLQFITEPGALTEESFAEFQQNIIDMGGEEMEAIYQAAYERYLEKIA